MAEPAAQRSSWLTRIALGSGTALTLGGAIVYRVSPADDYTEPTYSDIRTPAVNAMATGSVVLGAGIYLWLRETTASSMLSSALVGGGIAAMASGGALYMTDEDHHTQGYQRKYLRDTASIGTIIGWSGVALTGAGAWLLYRESRARPRHEVQASADTVTASAPVLSLSSSQAFVGWTGRFE